MESLSPAQMTAKYNLSPALAALNERLHARCNKLIAEHPRQRVVSIAPVVSRGRKAQSLMNPFYLRVMQDAEQAYPRWMDDVLSGTARLNWHGPRDEQIPLSTRKLLSILGSLEEVTTKGVQGLLCLNARHAQKYVQALRICMPHLLRCAPEGLLAQEVDRPNGDQRIGEHWHESAKRMRAQDYGPASISKILQQPLSTVKQYLRRNP